MKRILLFGLPILIVSVVFAVFGFFQARSIQERLIDEVKSKAKAVAESMELSAGQILATRDLRKAQRLIDRFETRERLQGCVLYDREGKLFVITKRLERADDAQIGELIVGADLLMGELPLEVDDRAPVTTSVSGLRTRPMIMDAAMLQH